MNNGSSDLNDAALRSVLRPAPDLAPGDSMERFLHLSRYLSVSELPVLEDGFLKGVASVSDALPVLAFDSPDARRKALEQPVRAILKPPTVTASPESSLEELGRLCAAHRVAFVPIADPDGYCHGVVLASDLLLPEERVEPRPGMVGGMATPFGVYLTDGSLRAGVGDVALIANGVLMGCLFLLSLGVVRGALWGLERYAHVPSSAWLQMDLLGNSAHPGVGLFALGLRLVALTAFLLFMRATNLAGFHAAEHQTVHAIERQERLVPEVVQRMPRAHPRCGTNLMAAGVVFFNLQQIMSYIPYFGEAATVFAALATLMTWRKFGRFLQERFTTRPARPREISSGIAAGEELLEKYLHSPPRRPNMLRRIWCMGLLQSLLGVLLLLGAVQLLDLYGPVRLSDFLLI